MLNVDRFDANVILVPAKACVNFGADVEYHVSVIGDLLDAESVTDAESEYRP